MAEVYNIAVAFLLPFLYTIFAFAMIYKTHFQYSTSTNAINNHLSATEKIVKNFIKFNKFSFLDNFANFPNFPSKYVKLYFVRRNAKF